MANKDFRHIVSVSGGKDSTATALWAKENLGAGNFTMIFSDTGNEAKVTLNYIRNLPEMLGLPPIVWVKADFTERLANRKDRRGNPKPVIDPTGNPFQDLMLWKGRAPSTKAQFCTEFLKMEPIRKWLLETRTDLPEIMYTGIRKQESPKRSTYEEYELLEFFDCATRRPLLEWKIEDVYKMHDKHGVPLNPLYALGFSRVGCFPCIHARKSELTRLPDNEWDKLERWENRLGSTWFAYGTIPLTDVQKSKLFTYERLGNEDQIKKFKNSISPSVADVRAWANTTRGGRQFDLFSELEADKDIPSCMSSWGICE